MFTATTDLEAARGRWEASGIEDYTFRLHNGCGECLNRGAVEIVVRDGAVESVAWVTPDPAGGDVVPFALSVDELFDYLAERLAERPWRVELEFAAAGYPLSADFDMDEETVDDEIALSVSAFARD